MRCLFSTFCIRISRKREELKRRVLAHSVLFFMLFVETSFAKFIILNIFYEIHEF